MSVNQGKTWGFCLHYTDIIIFVQIAIKGEDYFLCVTNSLTCFYKEVLCSTSASKYEIENRT